jgi:hypothetical protein
MPRNRHRAAAAAAATPATDDATGDATGDATDDDATLTPQLSHRAWRLEFTFSRCGFLGNRR